jgi:hypothetical protein
VLGITHVPEVGLLKEAFMAGVAWAQGQVRVPHEVPYEPVEIAPDMPNGARLLLSEPPLVDTGEPLDPSTLATLLAALAFYRDNVLNYGLIPGQLAPEAVTELITRLTPQEPV